MLRKPRVVRRYGRVLSSLVTTSYVVIFAAINAPVMCVAQEVPLSTGEAIPETVITEAKIKAAGLEGESSLIVIDGEPMTLEGLRSLPRSPAVVYADSTTKTVGTGAASVVSDGVIIELLDPSLIERLGSASQTVSRSQGQSSVGVSRQSNLASMQAAGQEISNGQAAVVNELMALAPGLQALKSSGARQAAVASLNYDPSQGIRYFTKTVNAVAIKGTSVEEVNAAIGQSDTLAKLVKNVHPDSPVKIDLIDSVNEIGASKAWTRISASGLPVDGTGIRVGIIDSGIDYRHPDLGGCFGPKCKVLGGYDFFNNDTDPLDENGHGTHVAAIVGGRGAYIEQATGASKSIMGVAPGVSLVALKVFGSASSTSVSTIIAAVEACVDPNGDGDPSDKLDVCNMSLGARGGSPDDILSTAVDKAVQAGVVMVVAAGNEGPGDQSISSPGTARNAITVAASCKDGDISGYCSRGRIATFSSRGPIPNFPSIVKPNISAPGVNICAAAATGATIPSRQPCLDKMHVQLSGTSMATPHIAGAVALLRQAHPSLSPAEIKDVLMAGATDLKLPIEAQGAGVVNIAASLDILGEEGITVHGGTFSYDLKPSAKVITGTRTVTITNNTNSQIQFTAGFTSDHEKLVGELRVQNSVIPAFGSTKLILDVTVDAETVPSESVLKGAVQLTRADGVRLALLPVRAKVLRRLWASSSEIDLGLQGGQDLGWSRQASLGVSNIVQDSSVSYQVTFGGFRLEGASSVSSPVDGVDASFERFLTIAPGDSANFSFQFSANGRSLPNGKYLGLIELSSPLETLRIPVTFFKGYEINLTYVKPVPDSVYVCQGANCTRVSPKSSDQSTAVRVTSREDWNVVGYWFWSGSLDHNFLNVREDVLRDAAASVLVPLDRAEAKKSVTILAEDGADEATTTQAWVVGFDRGKFPLFGRFVGTLSPRSPPQVISVNDLSPRLVVKAMSTGIAKSTIRVRQYFYRGSRSDENVLLKVGQYTSRFLALSSIDSSASEPQVRVGLNFDKTMILDLWMKIGKGETGILQTASNVNLTTESPDLNLAPSFSLNVADGPSTGVIFAYGPKLFSHPWLSGQVIYSPNGSNDIRRYAQEVGTSRGLGIGVGPLYFSSRWYNVRGATQATTVIRPYHLSRFGGGLPWLSAGDTVLVGRFAYPPSFKEVPDAHLDQYCATFGRATWSSFKPSWTWNYPWMVACDQWESSLSVNHTKGNTNLVSRLENRFPLVGPTAELRDQNPPSIKSIALIGDDVPQDVIDTRFDNELTFSVDPVPGLLETSTGKGLFINDEMNDGLGEVTLEHSVDGKVWESVPFTSNGDGNFRASLNQLPTADVHSFRISAVDIAGNFTRQSFQLVSGQGIVAPLVTPTPPQLKSEATATPTATPRATATATPSAAPTARPTLTPTRIPTATPTVAPVVTTPPGVIDTDVEPPKVSVSNNDVDLSVRLPHQSGRVRFVITGPVNRVGWGKRSNQSNRRTALFSASFDSLPRGRYEATWKLVLNGRVTKISRARRFTMRRTI